MKKSVLLGCMFFVFSAALFALSESDVSKQDSGPVKLTLWHRWSGANSDYLAQVVRAFEAKNKNIKIDIIAKPGEYMQLLQSMVADIAAGNQPPDLFIGGYNLLDYIATELQPTELKNLAPNCDRDSINPYTILRISMENKSVCRSRFQISSCT